MNISWVIDDFQFLRLGSFWSVKYTYPGNFRVGSRSFFHSYTLVNHCAKSYAGITIWTFRPIFWVSSLHYYAENVVLHHMWPFNILWITFYTINFWRTTAEQGAKGCFLTRLRNYSGVDPIKIFVEIPLLLWSLIG